MYHSLKGNTIYNSENWNLIFLYSNKVIDFKFFFQYLSFSVFLPWTEKLWSSLAVRRRYSTQPTSPLVPIRLLPYPRGLAVPTFSFSVIFFGYIPTFSFSVIGWEKNLKASDSNWDIASTGTPWLMTLKNPNSSQAFTMRLFASGFERSTMGISKENVVGMMFLTLEYCSDVGLDNRIMFFEESGETGEEKTECFWRGFGGSMNEWKREELIRLWGKGCLRKNGWVLGYLYTKKLVG